jgi:hypothetical protein
MGRPKKNLTGLRFHKLIAQFPTERRHPNQGYVFWHCICDCGKTREVPTSQLTCGVTKSCGQCVNPPFSALYHWLVYSAEKRKLSLDLTFEEFIEFTKQSQCHYCETSIFWASSTRRFGQFATNLDRKDNSLGYSKTNCVVCCHRCNRGKGELFSYEEWVIMATALCLSKRTIA